MGIRERESGKQRKVLLDDLERVGPEKPLGYLSIGTLLIDVVCDPTKIREELELRGLRTMMLDQWESNVGSGALFAYDEDALRALLKDREATLLAAGWPTGPEPFIRQLRRGAPFETDLYDVVADAFGDKTNPGRKNLPSGLVKADGPTRKT